MTGDDARILEYYDRVVQEWPGVERKGKTVPYTSVNGHMFSFLGKDGVVGLRLDKNGREAFMEKYGVGQPVQYGAVMKEYVEVPVELLQDVEKLMPYLKQSYTYVSSLKPKSTRR